MNVNVAYRDFRSARRPARAMRKVAAAVAAMMVPALAGPLTPAWAEPIENRVAVFAALDKITGDITSLEVALDEMARFGTFRIVPRTCHTRPPTERPKTMAFVEIDEFTYDRKQRRVFTGWMNAESPGLHAVEHPLFDVWLTGCREPLKTAQAPVTGGKSDMMAPAPGSSAAGAAGEADKADVAAGKADQAASAEMAETATAPAPASDAGPARETPAAGRAAGDGAAAPHDAYDLDLSQPPSPGASREPGVLEEPQEPPLDATEEISPLY